MIVSRASGAAVIAGALEYAGELVRGDYRKVCLLYTSIYDVIIIGGGPAGLAAGSYAGRSRMSTLIIEKEKIGGQIVITADIENYPGGVEGDSGPSLIDRMAAQADRFGAEKIYDTIVDLSLIHI